MAFELLCPVSDVEGVFVTVAVMTEDKIRAAVNECLMRCYRGDTPLGVIAEFASELRASGWQEEAIRQVESSVRKVLAGNMDENPAVCNEL